MKIFRVANRLFMVIVADAATFSFARKAEMDQANHKVAQWEELMWKFQKPLPFAKPGEKWVLLDQCIFDLHK